MRIPLITDAADHVLPYWCERVRNDEVVGGYYQRSELLMHVTERSSVRLNNVSSCSEREKELNQRLEWMPERTVAAREARILHQRCDGRDEGTDAVLELEDALSSK